MIKFIPVILFVVVTNAMSQSLLKQGMITIGALDFNDTNAIRLALRVAFDPWVIAGLTVMAVSMAAHLYVLSHVPLTFAFPFISVSYIVVLGIGYFVFGEKLNIYHGIGTLLIVAGIIFIGKAGDVATREIADQPSQTELGR